jgi:hypothetical protein
VGVTATSESASTYGRPVAFLDVDGVVSPIAGASMGPLPHTWSSWRRLSVGMPVFVAPECIARLTALPVERIWCSTWRGLVDGDRGLSAQLGWTGMPWLRLPPGDQPWDKRRAIETWFADHGARPFIWADDDLRLDLSGRPWAHRLPVPGLLIRPRKNVGLTPGHVTAMEQWVEKLGGQWSRTRIGPPNEELPPRGS